MGVRNVCVLVPLMIEMVMWHKFRSRVNEWLINSTIFDCFVSLILQWFLKDSEDGQKWPVILLKTGCPVGFCVYCRVSLATNGTGF